MKPAPESNTFSQDRAPVSRLHQKCERSERRESREGSGVADEGKREMASTLRTYGQRTFSVVAPRLWNRLPFEIRACSDVKSFYI